MVPGLVSVFVGAGGQVCCGGRAKSLAERGGTTGGVCFDSHFVLGIPGTDICICMCVGWNDTRRCWAFRRDLFIVMCARVATCRRSERGQVRFGADAPSNFLSPSLTQVIRAGPFQGRSRRHASSCAAMTVSLSLDKLHAEPSTRRALTNLSLSVAKCKKIVVVTGAGISCSCGIPVRSEKNAFSEFWLTHSAGFPVFRWPICARQAATPGRGPQGPRPFRLVTFSRRQIHGSVLHVHLPAEAVY